MDTASTVEIHEFSTGIRAEKTDDGSWVSRGFTGKYMNFTIDPLPQSVERAILNNEFAVTEGASSDKPAILGRVVGTTENAWSVIAVVTRGRDDKGRSVSVYRYFLCEGAHSLWKILAWWESKGMPRFNPFDTRDIGQTNIYVAAAQDNKVIPEAEFLDLNKPEPILLSPQEYNLQNLNILAIKKANINPNRQPISWAYNVEALEQPRRFLVIQAASDRAYSILQRAIANIAPVTTPVVADEEALKSAIRSLINSSQVKPEAVQVIVEALGNDQITNEYWHTLFDAQGAGTAISRKIYSTQMVRLLTLRAMVIPKTLPEFLVWLNVKGGNNPDEHQTVSLEFQQAIRSQIPKDKLALGIKFILPHLLTQEISPESVHWLLMVKGSAWVTCRQQFIDDITADLDLIAHSSHRLPEQQSHSTASPFRCGHEIWSDFIVNWQYIEHKNSLFDHFYKPLAELFKLLEAYRLSAYFYQMSEGIVPQKVFLTAFPDQPVFQMKYLGLILQRDVTPMERSLSFIKNFIRSESAYLALLVSLLFAVVVSVNFFIQFDIKTFFWNYQIYQAVQEDNFNKSVYFLKEIITSLENHKNPHNQSKYRKLQILLAIRESLCVEESECLDQKSLDSLIEKNNLRDNSKNHKSKEELVKIIYSYQQQRMKLSNPNGIINEATKKSLITDVKTKLGILEY